jgi:hypothetical protein
MLNNVLGILTFEDKTIRFSQNISVSQLSVWHSILSKVMGSNPETATLTGMFSWFFSVLQALPR